MTNGGPLWAGYGFTENPYSTEPVPASLLGEALLVGRDSELQILKARLTSTTTIPVLLGESGVGKTSIVSVAAFQLGQARVGGGPVYLAIDPPLQLGSQQTLERSEQLVYFAVARVLLGQPDLLTNRGIKRAQIKSLRRWLQDPESAQNAGGFTTPLGGVNWDKSSSLNESEGFAGFGVHRILDEWLIKCFPSSEGGGIICLIDNLEILGRSTLAQETVEALRDGLFAKRGLLWVLCGTPALMESGSFLSRRMEGRIARPTTINPVVAALAPELIARRKSAFGSSHSYAPVDGDGFEYLYGVVNSRLRSALDLCQDFAIFLSGRGDWPQGTDKLQLLKVWLANYINGLQQALPDIDAASWELLDSLGDLNGELSGRDASMLDFADADDLFESFEHLDRAGLVERVTLKDGDGVQITTIGWLIRHQQRDVT